MKIQFYCYLFPGGKIEDPYDVFRSARLLDAEPAIKEKGKSLSDLTRENCLNRPYSCYLLPSLDTEFGSDITYCEEALARIARLQRREIDCFRVGGNQFGCTLNQREVVIENYIFGECYEWPLSTFPLLHYKLALQGWRDFLDIPKAIGSELIVDLPELQYC